MPTTTTTTPVPYRGKYLDYFSVDEFVYDANLDLWQIIEITNTVDEPHFIVEKQCKNNDCGEGNPAIIKKYKSSDIFKLNQKDYLFNHHLNAKIAEYQEILDKLNSMGMR